MPKRLNVGKSRVIREKRLQELERKKRFRKLQKDLKEK